MAEQYIELLRPLVYDESSMLDATGTYQSSHHFYPNITKACK